MGVPCEAYVQTVTVALQYLQDRGSHDMIPRLRAKNFPDAITCGATLIEQVNAERQTSSGHFCYKGPKAISGGSFDQIEVILPGGPR